MNIGQFINTNIELAHNIWLKEGGLEYYYCFGNIRFQVRCIGNRLTNTLTPAISHAREEYIPGIEYCTIYALDSVALGSDKPPAVWPFATDTHQGHQRIHWDPDEGLALNSDESRGVWQLFNLDTAQGLYWVTDENTLPSWEIGSPLRIFIHWLTWKSEYQLIHAAGLQWNDNGILLTGPGGSGKSTTTAAAIDVGWKTIGDDFVLITNDKMPVAYSIYDTIKLTQTSLDQIEGLSEKITNQPCSRDDKARLHLSDEYCDQLINNMKISYIFSLQITNQQKTEILPVNKAHIMTALAPTTMFMLKTGMEESFQFMSAVVKNLYCYQIKLGKNPYEAIDSLVYFIDS